MSESRCSPPQKATREVGILERSKGQARSACWSVRKGKVGAGGSDLAVVKDFESVAAVHVAVREVEITITRSTACPPVSSKRAARIAHVACFPRHVAREGHTALACRV